VEQVARAVEAAGVEASCLKLEITENAFVRERSQAIELLHRLRAMGLTLSLDDFGTGYSSLAYIKHFPVQELKIDRSFVTNVLHDVNDAAIAQAVVALAHGMRLGVVAEGVESREQLDFLRRLGCDAVQGYLLSRPLAAEAVTGMLRSGAGRSTPLVA
jgi:EAL domain-containing protein (putative c-di-GMP-specific phosphodiesterase class I)